MEVINKTDKNIFLKILKLILILGSLILIIKLFLYGFYTTSAGSYIRIGTVMHLDWTYASSIAIVLFSIWIYLVFIYKERNKELALIFLFVLSLLGKQMFYLVNSDFDFYYNTKTVSYMDENRVLTDFDEFVRLYDKHCLDEKNWKFKGKYRSQMCWGKIPLDFGIIEDYKYALDYFNKTSNKELYSKVYNQSIKKFGLETMIEEYRDDTFYAIIIGSEWGNKDILDLVINNTTNENIKYSSNLIKIKLDEYFETKNKYDNFSDFEKEYLRINNEVDKISESIPGINLNIMSF